MSKECEMIRDLILHSYEVYKCLTGLRAVECVVLMIAE